MDDTIVCRNCERPACRPAEYEALCSRHYLLSVKAAEKAAHARFRAHVDSLFAARGQVWDWKKEKLAG